MSAQLVPAAPRAQRRLRALAAVPWSTHAFVLPIGKARSPLLLRKTLVPRAAHGLAGALSSVTLVGMGQGGRSASRK